jgi:MoxR-like ATPase
MAVKERIKKLLDQLNTGIFEKEEVIAIALLSSIAGESIFLLGPPGVAKSLIARRLKYAYKDAKVFEYLMSRFSTPDEIFGPVAISKLKEDKYERIVENYLPSADVVFLDEIWKAGPSIQNALLTILNEKIFRNGEEDIDVPIKALISASNELPAKDQGLEALWDRFLVRLIVGGIEDPKNFNAMIGMSSDPFKEVEKDIIGITGDEYKEWSKEIGKIKVPENVHNVIDVIRKKIEVQKEKEEENKSILWYVSDRRWRKIVQLMRTSAFVNDRTEVDLMDCFLIKHCIWNEESQIQTVSMFVNDTIEENGYTKEINLKNIEDEIEKSKTEIEKELDDKNTRDMKLVTEHSGYYEIINLPQPQYIEISAFNRLSDQNQKFFLTSDFDEYGEPKGRKNHNIRKDKSDHIVFIDDKECKLRTKMRSNPQREQKWNEFLDNQIKRLLQHIDNMNNQIEQYRNKDLAHLRTNLFVKPELAEKVESHITKTQKDIGKIKLKIREIQHNYKKLKDEEVILENEEERHKNGEKRRKIILPSKGFKEDIIDNDDHERCRNVF